jgi:glyoxylase-like metal-dependent hydrolase (beta-lactamase superfamily II)
MNAGAPPFLYLKQMEVGPMQNFIYLIGNTQTREAFVVDPAWDVKGVLEEASKADFKVVGALITHAHFDHVNALDDLLEEVDGTAYIHKNEAPYLKGMRANLKKVEGGERVALGDLEITFLHTPGHTPGSQCFLVANRLISGDTLFINACGRCDLPGGDAGQMYESLKRLSKLDPETILYPGHNYSEEPTSTIRRERESNPYLQFEQVGDFLKLRMRGA